jgi:hypothetical protein
VSAVREQRVAKFTAEHRQAAAEARRAAIDAGSRFRRDFAGAINWEKLAPERGIRLPAWWIAPTAAALKKHFKRLVDGRFRDVYGCSPARLIELNPDWPLRAFVGVMLESAAQMERPVALDDAPASDLDCKSRAKDTAPGARGQSDAP